MRTYLVDNDGNEIIFNLTESKTLSHSLMRFDYLIQEEEKEEKLRLWVRSLSGNLFVSKDQKSWKKVARQNLPQQMLVLDQVYQVYRGFRPSGLGKNNAGELLTQMPGKVIKINVKVGDAVQEGDTMLILEAMKMENEIKSGLTGKVKAIHVKEGQALESGLLMMELE